MRRSRLLFFLTVSLEAKASSTNWKLVLAWGVGLSRLALKLKRLYVADGYLSAEQRQYLELSGQTAYFQQLFSQLVVQYQVVDDNPVQQSYVYPPYCELAA